MSMVIDVLFRGKTMRNVSKNRTFQMMQSEMTHKKDDYKIFSFFSAWNTAFSRLDVRRANNRALKEWKKRWELRMKRKNIKNAWHLKIKNKFQISKCLLFRRVLFNWLSKCYFWSLCLLHKQKAFIFWFDVMKDLTEVGGKKSKVKIKK